MLKLIVTKEIEEGKWYMTCIKDHSGIHHIQKLFYKDNKWWSIDRKSAYYTPTHFIDN